MARKNRPTPPSNRDLRRRRSHREPSTLFALYCEGKNTEPAYFDALKKSCSKALISVQVNAGVGVPMTIARAAVKFAKSRALTRHSRRKKDSFEENDSSLGPSSTATSILVFQEAVNLCEEHGIRVARSNPCFELWLNSPRTGLQQAHQAQQPSGGTWEHSPGIRPPPRKTSELHRVGYESPRG